MTSAVVRIPDADERLRDIQVLTDAELSHLEAREFLPELLDRTKGILRADTAALLLLDRASGELIAVAARGLEEEVRQGVRLPLGRGFAGRIAADRRPVIIDRVDHTTVLNPILMSKGIRSMLGVPLMVGGTVIGVLHVGSLTHRQFTAADAEILQLAADRAASVVQSQMTHAERSAAAALQRSLLPSALPVVAGLEIASRYVPGDGRIGGDWYDVFVLPTGEPCAVMGDVAGSGLQAAVIMGRLRTAVRSYALERRDPAEVLSMLDRHVLHFEPDTIATVLYAVFEPGLERMEISSAGHFPPVVAGPRRPPALADVAADPLVGAAPVPRTTTTIALPPGGTLCFYTDGLVERRGKKIGDGLDLLCRSVADATPAANCAAVMQALVGQSAAQDDIALLVFRRTDPARSQ